MFIYVCICIYIYICIYLNPKPQTDIELPEGMSKEEAVQILTTQLNSAVQRGEEVSTRNHEP